MIILTSLLAGTIALGIVTFLLELIPFTDELIAASVCLFFFLIIADVVGAGILAVAGYLK